MGNNDNTRRGLGGASESGGSDAGWTLDYGIKQYVIKLRAESVSSDTIKHHEKSQAFLRRYSQAMELLHINDFESRDINGFFAALDCPDGGLFKKRGGGGYSQDNKHNIGVDIKALFNWLALQRVTKKGERVSILTNNPFFEATIPPRSQRVLPPYTPKEIEEMVKACDGPEPLRIRDKALLLFLLDAAPRREECQTLKIRDIDLDKGEAVILDGKGGSSRITVFDRVANRALMRYLNLDFMVQVSDDEPLWWGKEGPLTYEGLGEVVENIGVRAKIGRGSCHKLRRTAAITMLRNGASLEDVRRLLGHRDLQVVARYLAYLNEDLKNAHRRHSPANTLAAPKDKQSGLAKKGRRKRRPQNLGGRRT